MIRCLRIKLLVLVSPRICGWMTENGKVQPSRHPLTRNGASARPPHGVGSVISTPPGASSPFIGLPTFLTDNHRNDGRCLLVIMETRSHLHQVELSEGLRAELRRLAEGMPPDGWERRSDGKVEAVRKEHLYKFRDSIAKISELFKVVDLLSPL